jgi:enoyl-CoA hydratase
MNAFSEQRGLQRKFMPKKSVIAARDGKVLTVTINRPEVRNAVDSATAAALAIAFKEFEADDTLCAAVLTGAGGTFCAGADLREVAEGRRATVEENGPGPMGPTWLQLSKPVIAAVEGHAVAGGLELALWCDLRVAARDAVLGVFNRRFGVPPIDLGTVRLPRMIGQGRALDLILTGRGVSGEEALQIGLVNRLAESGKALETASELAHTLAAFPQHGLRADRMSVYEQWSLSWEDARRNELKHGLEVLASGESRAGAQRFTSGEGKHGSFKDKLEG